MKFQRNFRDTLKPIGSSLFCFALFSFLFVIGYLHVDYKIYVKNYHILQAQEVETIQQKTNTTIDRFEEILGLIDSRIYVAQGNVQRIQKILSSTTQLANTQKLPEIQGISFYKLSAPQMVITRFGMLPLDPTKLLADITIIKNRGSLTNVNNKGLIDRFLVFGVDGSIEGMLEIQISLLEFWKFLGTYDTVYFDQGFLKNTTQNQARGRLFPIKKKDPLSFLAYAMTHHSTYRGFGLYFLFSLLLLGLCIYALSVFFERIYHMKVSKLEEALIQSEEKEKTLSEELWNNQRVFHNHQASCQLQKKLQGDVKNKKIEYANDLIDSLDTLKNSFDPHSSMAYKERVDLLDTCMHQVINLSMGLWDPTIKENTNLKEIINNISVLFAERIQSSNININTDAFPETATTLLGDALFIELVLINTIGKLIYRIPKNGKMFISVSETEDGFNIEIQDNSYTTASLIRNPFDFFIEDVIFQQVCQENHISCKRIIGKNGGMNVTNIMLPISQTDTTNSNVVQLFK